jgi:hypothetical protein
MEQWKNYFGYDVSNLGRIKSKRNQEVMTPYVKKHRCLQIDLYIDGVRHKMKVARLVAMVWIRKPPHSSYDCRHINGDTFDNRVSNLIWTEVLRPKPKVFKIPRLRKSHVIISKIVDEPQLWLYAF